MSAALNLPSVESGASAPRGRSVGTRSRRSDQLHFRIVYVLVLPVLMLSTLVRRVLTGSASGTQFARPSILREAKAAAQTCGSLSLMG